MGSEMCIRDRHIGKLSLDGGELQVDGRVEALTYEEQQAPRGSWLTRLLG